jgi:CheY-like chemotaxis protein
MKTLNILLADDDSTDRFFFDEALKEVFIPTHLTTVNDGEELLKYLTVNDLPDVIFLDLNMPRKNGAECLIEIKNKPALKNIPIVIYSTSLHKEVANELYKNGAHYYLQKCDFSELRDAIQRVLTLLGKSPSQPSRKDFIASRSKV